MTINLPGGTNAVRDGPDAAVALIDPAARPAVWDVPPRPPWLQATVAGLVGGVAWMWLERPRARR